MFWVIVKRKLKDKFWIDTCKRLPPLSVSYRLIKLVWALIGSILELKLCRLWKSTAKKIISLCFLPKHLLKNYPEKMGLFLLRWRNLNKLKESIHSLQVKSNPKNRIVNRRFRFFILKMMENIWDLRLDLCWCLCVLFIKRFKVFTSGSPSSIKV